MARKRKTSRLTVADIHGCWPILVTPATPDASDWRCEDSVDYDEAARAVDELVKSGVDGILSMGTYGECAGLTWEEKKKFMATIIDANAGRVPLFVGTTTLNTRDTIAETRYAADLGADGTMLGVPMWCAPSVDVAVQFYRDVAEACPDMAICVYANPEAFKFEFPRPFWARVADIPQIVMAKYLNIGHLIADLHVTKGRIRFLPLEGDYYAAARIDPEQMTAFWGSGPLCGPEISLALRDTVAAAKKSGDWSAAKAVSGDISRSAAGLFPEGSFKLFSMYNVAIVRERVDAAGWMKAGPHRPPYHVVPEDYAENARHSGRVWAELMGKYRTGKAA